MPTQCNQDSFAFARVAGRQVVAAFDSGVISSDAGALLLGATDRVLRFQIPIRYLPPLPVGGSPTCVKRRGGS